MQFHDAGLGLGRRLALIINEFGDDGRLHQDLAAAADRVNFMTAGLPMDLKMPAEAQSRIVKSHGS